MRILVTNDDGINAPGIDVLQTIARSLSDDVWVIAPETDQSGVSRSITLHDPLRLREVSEQVYAVKGTPADCVIMGTRHVLRDAMPDLILSGVNRGQNLADDVHYSGTIAGAMEGAMLGIPAVALSLAINPGGGADGVNWDMPLAHGKPVLDALLKQGWSKDVVLNVNFPTGAVDTVKGTTVTSQGKRSHGRLSMDERHDTWGRPYYWFGFEPRLKSTEEGTDSWAVQNGMISITPLKANMTDPTVAKALNNVFQDVPK